MALGRRLARSLGAQDDEESELELELGLEDEPDVEISGVVFSTLKRYLLRLCRPVTESAFLTHQGTGTGWRLYQWPFTPRHRHAMFKAVRTSL